MRLVAPAFCALLLGASPASAAPEAAPAQPLWFAGSALEWGHAATAQTLGLGGSYQSANPTYEMALAFAPQARIAGDAASQVFVSGRLELVREWTNSDVTTREGETTLSDALLFSGLRTRLYRDGGHETTLVARAPILTFPTSTFSSSNGTLLGLGGGLSLQHRVPLMGRAQPPSVTFGAAVEYLHTFTDAVVPTNPELRRERMGPDGRTSPGDQLTAAAFAEHELRLQGVATLAITEQLAWLLSFSYRPVWKYDLGTTEVCVATGCEPLDDPRDPTRLIVVTGFATGASYAVLDELSVSLGYSNGVTQPGPDGRRQNPFYSPGAQVALTLELQLDALYLAVRGDKDDVAARR